MARSNSSAATLRVRKPATEGTQQEPSVPTLRWIVETNPEETLRTCTEIVRFLGDSLMHRGGRDSMEAQDGDSYMRLLHTVADALEYETKRAGEATS
jgi:hypothetical protein